MSVTELEEFTKIMQEKLSNALGPPTNKWGNLTDEEAMKEVSWILPHLHVKLFAAAQEVNDLQIEAHEAGTCESSDCRRRDDRPKPG